MLKAAQTLRSCLVQKQKQVLRINELPKAFLKTSSSLSVKELPSPENLPGKDWNELYTVPGIRYLYVCSRLKFYVPGVFLVTSVPTGIILTQMGEESVDIFTGFLFAGVIQSIIAFGISTPITDTVGAVRISKDKSKLMIVTFNFWGKPDRIIIPSYDVRKIEPKYPLENKFFVRYQLGDDSERTIKMLKGNAPVTDRETFTKVFGEDVLTPRK